MRVDRCRDLEIIRHADFLPAVAALLNSLASDDIDEAPPHELSGHGQKMSATLPADATGVDEPDVGLIDERGRLQWVLGPLAPHVKRYSRPVELSDRAFAHSGREDAMTRTWTALRIGLVLIGSGHNPVAAQELKPAVFGAAAVANVYGPGDRSFGTELNVGGGLGIEWKRLGIDAEVHRTLGLMPRTVQCGISNVLCVGSAREGFLEATMLSGNVSYFFGGPRVRPYVTGSVGVLWTENVGSLTIVSSTAANVSEFHESDTGLAIGAGFGVDVPLTPALSLRPEFRTYSSVAMSRVNVGLHRGAIGVRYRW